MTISIELDKADAILTADWHLRDDQPICRTDNFWEIQWIKVLFVRSLQQEHGCPVIHAGDLFNNWKASPHLLSMCVRNLPDNFHTVYGNHDLPQHSLELSHKSGVTTLETAHRIQILKGTHWGQKVNESSLFFPNSDMSMLVWHVMTFMGNKPWGDCNAGDAVKLLKNNPGYNIIVTGHNHKSFQASLGDRLLINPGSLTRQEADKDEHQPKVYLWYAATNTVVAVPLPYDDDVISREHLEKNVERNERIAAFIDKLDADWKVGINFNKNLERFHAENQDIGQDIMDVVWKAVTVQKLQKGKG